MSGATESLVSELDPLSSDCTTGQRTEDLGNYVHNDDVGSDDDDDGNDSDDDSNDGIEEPDVHGAEAAIFSEGPWHGLDLSAEEQLQSLQSGKNNKLYRELLIVTHYSFVADKSSASPGFICNKRRSP